MQNIWFPPRLVQVEDDDDEGMDKAVELYLDEGIAICPVEGDAINNCFKIINFSKQFPEL